LAATISPPIAYILRPSIVYFSSKVASMYNAMTINTPICKPLVEPSLFFIMKSCACEKAIIDLGTFTRNIVPTKARSAPRKRFCVPNVTIKEGNLNVVIKNALTSPRRIPINVDTKNITPIEPVHCRAINAFVVTYIEKAAIAIKETSIPPDIVTNSTPIPNMLRTRHALNTLNQLPIVKKLGFINPNSIDSPIIKIISKISFDFRSFLNICFPPH